MAVVLRLTRGGAKKKPFYRIVATDKRKRRDGNFLEVVGTYNPSTKEQGQKAVIAQDRVAYWLKNGAVPSAVVQKLIGKQSPASATA